MTIILRDGLFCLFVCLVRWEVLLVVLGDLAGGSSLVELCCRPELFFRAERMLGRSSSARTSCESDCGCDAVYKKSKGAPTTVRHDLALSGFNLGWCPGGLSVGTPHCP